MRRFLLLGTLVLLILAAVFRQRIFVRDPLGRVERGGVVEDGARVYINYSDDVLVEEPGTARRYLVQGWSALPGVPKQLGCLTGLLCVTDGDEAAVFPLAGIGGSTKAVMSTKAVTFIDETGAGVRVTIR